MAELPSGGTILAYPIIQPCKKHNVDLCDRSRDIPAISNIGGKDLAGCKSAGKLIRSTHKLSQTSLQITQHKYKSSPG